jgi:hypothetical protein
MHTLVEVDSLSCTTRRNLPVKVHLLHCIANSLPDATLAVSLK